MTPTLLRTDCIAHLQSLPDASVDAIVTDPPYMYLDHRLDRPFDVEAYAREVARVLRPRGLCVHFGRGPMLWALHAALQAGGMVFREEIVWDKMRITGPTLPIARRHELAVIMGRKGGTLRRGVRLSASDTAAACTPKGYEKILSELGIALDGQHPERAEALREFLAANPGQPERLVYPRQSIRKPQPGSTCPNLTASPYRHLHAPRAIFYGQKLPSIVRASAPHARAQRLHPTEKPVSLLRYLVRLVSDPGDTILDPFAGSGSAGEAALREGRGYTACEIDGVYFARMEARLARVVDELQEQESARSSASAPG